LEFDPASDMVHFADGRLLVDAGPGNCSSDALAEDLKELVEAANVSEVRRRALELPVFPLREMAAKPARLGDWDWRRLL
jgi:hypothetical protein